MHKNLKVLYSYEEKNIFFKLRKKALEIYSQPSLFCIFKQFYINNDLINATHFMNIIGNKKSVLHTGEIFYEIQKERTIFNHCSSVFDEKVGHYVPNINHIKILTPEFLKFVQQSSSLTENEFIDFVEKNKILNTHYLPLNHCQNSVNLLYAAKKYGRTPTHNELSMIAKKYTKGICDFKTIENLLIISQKHMEKGRYNDFAYPVLSMYEVLTQFIWKTESLAQKEKFTDLLIKYAFEPKFLKNANVCRMPVDYILKIATNLNSVGFSKEMLNELFTTEIFYNITGKEDLIKLVNFGFDMNKKVILTKNDWVYPLLSLTNNDFFFLVRSAEDKFEIIKSAMENGLNLTLEDLKLYKEKIPDYSVDESLIEKINILVEHSVLSEKIDCKININPSGKRI